MKEILLATMLSVHVTSLAASASLPVPERGFVSSRPAENWEEGLISGNGTIGVNALSRPLERRVLSLRRSRRLFVTYATSEGCRRLPFRLVVNV